MYWFFASLGIVLVVCLFWWIDDWRRDFIQNRAATDDDADAEELRSVPSELPAEEVVNRVRAAVDGLSGWEWIDDESAGESHLVHLVRTTRLCHFKDDVTITIQNGETGTSIEAESASRIGIGDLGQNPRNLKEILGALRAHLAKG